jgi:beta-N-acetylhexosaminidase
LTITGRYALPCVLAIPPGRTILGKEMAAAFATARRFVHVRGFAAAGWGQAGGRRGSEMRAVMLHQGHMPVSAVRAGRKRRARRSGLARGRDSHLAQNKPACLRGGLLAAAVLIAPCLAPLLAGTPVAEAGQAARLPAAAAAGGLAGCRGVAGSEVAWVACMLRQMNLAEKVGQMFMINAYGTSATDTSQATVAANQSLYGPGVSTIADVISTYHPGGIIYFTWSNGLTDPHQVVGLSNGIQQAALSQPVPAPMLISIDQEEGWIVRIGPPATVFPGNMALGATGSTRLAYSNAAITGQELRAMGVNVDNAPVVDVNTNPLNTADGIRSFGDSTLQVSRFSAAAVAGYQGPGNVAAVAKHFPGLGDTSTNPDTGVTVSDQTLAQFKRVNFPPFSAAIRAGTDEVMVTSVVAPKVDPSGTPAVLSRIFVTGLLRGYLGYRGVIVTDAMNAAALSAYPPGQAARMAIRAGDDELLYAQQPGSTPGSDFAQAYDAVLAAVRHGQISLSRIIASDTRLLRLKWQLGLARNPLTDPTAVDRVVGTAPHLAVARRTAEDSITVIKNKDHLLPLRLRRGTSVLVTGYGSTGLPVIGHNLASRGLTARVLVTGPCPTAGQITQAVAAARRAKVVLVATWNVWNTTSSTVCPSGYGSQTSLVNALLATRKPVIAASVGTPYDIAYYPAAPTYVATYDPQPVSLDALVAVLFRDVPPSGRLPVTITKPPPSTTVLFPRGWGLRY